MIPSYQLALLEVMASDVWLRVHLSRTEISDKFGPSFFTTMLSGLTKFLKNSSWKTH
jgi:hypothetical protein